MNIASLDLNLLVALDALLQEQSVSRAGQKIGLSQPAMSHALGRLRALLDDPLLVRMGGQMRLTLRAQAMRLPVRHALERVQEVFISQSFVAASSTRTFHVYMSDYASNLLLPPWLKAVRRSAPGVRIEVHPWRGVAVDSAESGIIPDAVVACHTRHMPGFYRQRLFTDRDICVMRAGHRLQGSRLDLDTFLETRHVAVASVEFSADPVDAWLQELGHPRRVAVTVPHYIEALHLVAQTELIAVVPERLVRAYASTLKLAMKTVPLDVGTFDEYLLHSERTHSDPGCCWLRESIKNICPAPGRRAGRRVTGIDIESARLGVTRRALK